MRIEDLLEKKERLQLSILQQLVVANGQLSYVELRDSLGISKTSLETYLAEIADYFKAYPKKCQLIVDGRAVSLKLATDFNLITIYRDYLAASLKFQLLDYIYQQQEFTVVKITRDLMLSESSLFRKIKELNQLLEEFKLQIKNGSLQGEELQIRYFYFKLYSLMRPYREQELELALPHNQRLMKAIQKELMIEVSPFNQVRLSLWLGISMKRVSVTNKSYHEVRRKSKVYSEDQLFKKVRKLVLLYFSRYSIEFAEEEGMLHFIFLTTMSILTEEDFTNYDHLRNRRTKTALIDTLLRETILLHYRPRKPTLVLEKKINYYLSQINGLLYFFEGNLESKLQAQAVTKKEEHPPLGQLARDLLTLALTNIEQVEAPESSLQLATIASYRNVLAIIQHNIYREIKIGVDLKLIEIEKERLNQLISLRLKNIIGVAVEPIQVNQSYDLIITNALSIDQYANGTEVYLLTDLFSSFDTEEIKKEIKKIKER